MDKMHLASGSKYYNESVKYSKKYLNGRKLESNDYSIRMNDFEGPLDLLLHLVKSNKMDIYDIDISKICDDYVDYINEMKRLNLEIATEFIVMASNLLLIKSRKILPDRTELLGEEEVTEEMLIEQIVNYKKYKMIALELRERNEYFKYRSMRNLGNILTGYKFPKKTLSSEHNYDSMDLAKKYKLQILKFKEKQNKKKEDVEMILEREVYTVKSKLKEIFNIFKTRSNFVFNNVFMDDEKTRPEIIAAFQAVLEMSNRSKLTAYQSELFGDIKVEKK